LPSPEPNIKTLSNRTKRFPKDSGPKEKTHQDNTSKKSDMQAKYIIYILLLLSFFIIISNFDNDENSSPNEEQDISKSDTPAYLKSIPEPYYVKPERSVPSTYPGVKQVLMARDHWGNYEMDEFDCSEMAAYIEWKLENNGIDAKICRADNFLSSGIGHAWVAVDLPLSRRCFIEATAMKGTYGIPKYAIIRGNDRDIDAYMNYSNYDAIFEDVYEASKYYGSTQEWDWWGTNDISKADRSILHSRK
jgi:hypothetical protein